MAVKEFDTSDCVVAGMPEDYFAELTQAFVDHGLAKTGRVGSAQAYLLPAPALVDFAINTLEQDFG